MQVILSDIIFGHNLTSLEEFTDQRYKYKIHHHTLQDALHLVRF